MLYLLYSLATCQECRFQAQRNGWEFRTLFVERCALNAGNGADLQENVDPACLFFMAVTTCALRSFNPDSLLQETPSMQEPVL